MGPTALPLRSDPLRSDPLPSGPRRDPEALDALERVGSRARPLVLARDRTIRLSGGLGELIPGGALTRGSVLRIAGDPAGGLGWGATTVGFTLAAAVTGTGEWAAAVDLDGTLGALAAAEVGVELERFAVVRRVPPARWATVVAALLDGVSIVLAEVPRGVSLGDARRLVARARERGTVLVVHERAAPRFEVAFTLHAASGGWAGLEEGGHLTGRAQRVRVEGRGAAARPISGGLVAGELARAV
jgi:hypothetical protein